MSATAFEGVFFDGRRSARHAVRAEAFGGRLRVTGDAIEREVDLARVRIERAIADGACRLALPDGEQLRTRDVGAIDAIFGRPADSFVRRLEGRWMGALLALLLVAAAVGVTWRFGIPVAASVVAERMPRTMQDAIGGDALATLDKTVCKLSRLSPAEQDDLEAKTLRRIVAGLPEGDRYSLDFRDCKLLGANAFALPSARVVVTDDLLRITNRDPELLAAVMAHEVGHLREKHPLRMALQGVGVSIVVTAVAGDALTLTSLAAALPAALVEMGYSRRFESEADDEALQLLEAAGIPPERFADALERLHASHPGEGRGDWFASHPDTEDRIARARKRGTPR